MSKIHQSVEYAAKIHNNQFRNYPSHHIPYITHCLDVMKKVHQYTCTWTGHQLEPIMCAAVLHDCEEDSHKHILPKIKRKFGDHIANLVMELTNPEDVSTFFDKYSNFHSFKHKSTESCLIKLADRYCNVQDFMTFDASLTSYGRKYALQAYPLIKVIAERQDVPVTDFLLNDLLYLNEVISVLYPDINLYTDDETEIIEAIKNQGFVV